MLTKSEIDQIGEVVEKTLKPIKKDLKYLRKTVDLVVKNYDEGDARLERRLTKIEQHLSI